MVVSAYEIFMVYWKKFTVKWYVSKGLYLHVFKKSGSMGLYFLGLSIIKIFSNMPGSSREMSSWDQALKNQI